MRSIYTNSKPNLPFFAEKMSTAEEFFEASRHGCCLGALLVCFPKNCAKFAFTNGCFVSKKILMNHFLIYQAYGKEEIKQECLFSLLSLRYHASEAFLEKLQIIIYTDSPEDFSLLKQWGLQPVYELLSPEKLQDWRGSIDFVHRVKIKMLQDAAQKYEGKFIYLDTDTYFLQSPEPLFARIEEQHYLMHVAEGALGSGKNLTLKKLHHFLSHHRLLVEGQSLSFSPELMMWNAGVLGFCSQEKHLLEKVLLFTDALYILYPKHIAEQFAFSYYMQAQRSASDAYIFHYWNFKEFRALLSSFFQSFAQAPAKAYLSAFRDILPEHLMKNKMEYEALSFLPKTLRKIRGKKWEMPSIDWQQLLHSSRSK